MGLTLLHRPPHGAARPHRRAVEHRHDRAIDGRRRHRVRPRRCLSPIPTRSTWSVRSACRLISVASVEQVNERGHGLHLDYSLDDPSDPGADLRAQRSLPVREARHPHRVLLHRRARRLPRPGRRDRPHRLRQDAPHRADGLRHGPDHRRSAGAPEARRAARSDQRDAVGREPGTGYRVPGAGYRVPPIGSVEQARRLHTSLATRPSVA